MLVNEEETKKIELSSKIKRLNSAKEVYDFALELNPVQNEIIEKLADLLIAFRDPFYILCFSKEFKLKKAKILELADTIIELEDAEDICKFAATIYGAPIEKLADAIIKIRMPDSIVIFAEDVKDAPMDKLADAIIKLGDAVDIYEFSCIPKEFSKNKLADAIIKTENIYYIHLFAETIYDAPIDKLADAVIELGTPKDIYEFARYVEGAPIDKLADAIIKTENAEYIYEFAYNIEEAPIDKLAEGIIKTESAEYIYKFAYNIKEAPIDKLVDAVIKIGDKKYISLFIESPLITTNNYPNSVFVKLLNCNLGSNTVKILVKCFISEPKQLINFIDKFKEEIDSYDHFSEKLFEILRWFYWKYFENVLKVYEDYIIDPFTNSENLDELDIEYNELIKEKEGFSKKLLPTE